MIEERGAWLIIILIATLLITYGGYIKLKEIKKLMEMKDADD